MMLQVFLRPPVLMHLYMHAHTCTCVHTHTHTHREDPLSRYAHLSCRAGLCLESKAFG